jgi:hypothetical protein
MDKKYTNDLIHETSLYLLQHAHNPVNWYSWNENTLSLAKNLNKPILLSIGYAACHWCHVMERESFEDLETAKFMNEHFINIKIDREERPDIDSIYMDAVQILTGSGGWPLNVFLTPDGKPFYGGTYFPPKKLYNRPSWMDVLKFICDIWINNPSTAEDQAQKLLNHIKSLTSVFSKVSHPMKIEKWEFTASFCNELNTTLLKSADKTHGGFGSAPKFPQTFSIQFLLAYGKFYDCQESTDHALFSLKSMMRGGIYDHLAGGLCRYSTDDEWLAPHFEKMLYDNALFISVLSDAYQICKDEEIKKCIQKTITFCDNELKNNEGGYFAAIDADSEGEEGKFYLWDKSETDLVLEEVASEFNAYYGITEKGNWEGKNILNKSHHFDKKINNTDDNDLIRRIINCEEKLLSHRNKRIRPITDDKIILGWNALYLTALCKASAALKEEKYIVAAEELFSFLESNFFKSNHSLFHTYKNYELKFMAYLDDYAYLIQSCILLQEITGNEKYLDYAKSYTQYVIDNFGQENSDFFYYTNQKQIDLIIRKIDNYDSALPSGNSVMAFNLKYLAEIFQIDEWKNQSLRMLNQIKILALKHPNSFAFWSFQIVNQSIENYQIVLTGKENTAIRASLNEMYIPNKVLQSTEKEKKYPLLEGKKIHTNECQMYICSETRCYESQQSLTLIKLLTKN